ncbi:MAG: ankyrin repeat domain-containing protein [Sedimentisphaerales bacterium]|nr:ankyrin repeat domain-containing protein [Sedimentisphaerales bacterium]
MKLCFHIPLVFVFLTITELLPAAPSKQLLQDAIVAGDLPNVQQLLKEYPELASTTIATPSKGRGGYEVSALFFAIKSGQSDIAKALLAVGADPTRDMDRGKLLCYAACQGYADLIPLLIQKGLAPNVESQRMFERPVMALGLAKDTKTAQALLDCGADVNARTKNAETPLHTLVSFGAIDAAPLLITHGADVNAKDNHGQTPLHLASWFCQTEKARLLLDNGADVNALDNEGRNALRRTIEERTDNSWGLERPSFYETLQLLISRGSDADAGAVVYAGDLKRLEERLEREPGLIDTYQFRGESLLIIAIYEGHDDIVEYLFKKGADPGVMGRFKDPALHLAAFAGNPKTVELLIKAGLPVNQKGAHGELPLHWIARLPNEEPYQRQCHYEDIAKILIDAGSELNAKAQAAWISIGCGVDGKGPIDQISPYLSNLKATRSNIHVQLFAPPALAFDVGDSPLHCAARWGRIEIVKMLIEAGARIDQTNALGQTPLHYAVVYQHSEVIRALLKAGADPTIKTNKNMDAFLFAETINDPTIVSLLNERR